MIAPLHVTLMLGGPSAEREISLKSGKAAGAALRSLGHWVEELDPITPSWTLPPATEVVFLALHGSYGEDGMVQSQLEELGVPFTGSGSEASRVAFDKVLTKQRCLEHGLPTPRFVTVNSEVAPWPDGWAPPLVIKPVRQGSSVGLEFAGHPDDWTTALRKVLDLGGEALVEEKVSGREVTVGVLAGRALPVLEIRPRQGAFDYHNKYTPGASKYLCPAPFPEALTRAIQRAALEAFQAVGGRDFGRVDAIVRPHGEPALLEVNTLPGLTETSLLPKAAEAAGISYAQLCQQMIEMALQREGSSLAPVGSKIPHVAQR